MSPHARVVIATYNQVPSLKLVLRGYLRQTTNDFSMILADDGSGPDQVAFLREIKPEFEARGIRFEHVWHEDLGWRKNMIMNEAVRGAGDETLLIFSDGDCIPPAQARIGKSSARKRERVAGAPWLGAVTVQRCWGLTWHLTASSLRT